MRHVLSAYVDLVIAFTYLMSFYNYHCCCRMVSLFSTCRLMRGGSPVLESSSHVHK